MDEGIAAAIADGTIGARMEAIRERLARWDEAFIRARISPGGCADLLALTLLAHFMT